MALSTRIETKQNTQIFQRAEQSAKDAYSQPGRAPFRKGCQEHAQFLLSMFHFTTSDCVHHQRKKMRAASVASNIWTSKENEHSS